MELYLVRHGAATAKAENPDRPLTEPGAATVDRVAAFLARAGAVSAADIHHSTKLRARQTAERMRRGLDLDAPLREADGIGPTDDPVPLAATLAEEERDTMIVGHLPFLARLAGQLMYGDATSEPVDFPAAAVLCLGREPESDEEDTDRRWTVRWMVVPELVGD